MIIGAKTTRFGGAEPTWSQWSFATTAGQHGAGFCPITGLQIPEGGYLSAGQSSTPLFGTFTLNSVTIKNSFLLGTDSFQAPAGQKLIQVCGALQAGPEYRGWFFAARDYNVDTNAGTAFTMLDDDVAGWSLNNVPQPGQSNSSCETWVIPVAAQTVIVAVNNWQSGAELYKVDLP